MPSNHRQSSTVETAEVRPTTDVTQPRRQLRRVARVIRRVLAALVCGLFVLFAVLVVSEQWEALPVLSGSMSPGMPTGSLAFAQREPVGDLVLHDVAVFHPPGQPRVIYLHRVIAIQQVGSQVVVRTKGDANPVPDPWVLHIASPTVYIVRYRVPDLGYVALWVHSKTGREVVLTVAGLLGLALVLLVLRDARRAANECSF